MRNLNEHNITQAVIAERALGRKGVSAAAGLLDLALENRAPVALKDIGMRQADLAAAAYIAIAHPHWNPRPIGSAQRAEIRELLQHACEGVRPDASVGTHVPSLPFEANLSNY